MTLPLKLTHLLVCSLPSDAYSTVNQKSLSVRIVKKLSGNSVMVSLQTFQRITFLVPRSLQPATSNGLLPLFVLLTLLSFDSLLLLVGALLEATLFLQYLFIICRP